MGAILVILFVIMIVLLIRNHGFKKRIEELSNKNEKLNEKNKILAKENKRLNKTKAQKQSSVSKKDKPADNKGHIDIPVRVTMHYDDSNEYQSDPKVTYDDSYWREQNQEQAALLDKYNLIQSARPDYRNRFGRPLDYPKYTDKYDTNTGFTLRELLLLVWWGKVKKGRLTSARIPHYFIYEYNLNVRKVTQKFIDKGWLTEKNGRYILSKEAKQVVDFYGDLWEIHQADGFPICLDKDFTKWNHGKMLITFYKDEIEFQHKLIKFYKKLKSFYENNSKFFIDKQMQDNHIQSVDESILDSQSEIERNEKLIKALE